MSKPRSRIGDAIRQVEFHRTKYGREILVDAAWISDMPAFDVSP